MEGARELRAGALALLASVLRRFPRATDYAPLWPRLFLAAEPLLPRLVAEVGSWELPSCAESSEQQLVRCIGQRIRCGSDGS